MLFTSDEEIGSRASRELLEQRAIATGAVLVLEPSADGGVLKTGRKGAGTYFVTVKGRASHAGLEPEKGINALLALAELIPQFAATARPELGTTVTPTLASAGTADNVVPDTATCAVDARVVVPSEKDRLHADMHAVRTTVPGVEVVIEGAINRPPLHHTASTELFAMAQDVARELQLGEVKGIEVGGASDGNFTAAVGVQTLDGLGAVGAGAHSEDEHIVVSTMPARAALVAGLCQRLSSMAKRPPLVSVPAER
jgi:glutamate carboxypeptidase